MFIEFLTYDKKGEIILNKEDKENHNGNIKVKI